MRFNISKIKNIYPDVEKNLIHLEFKDGSKGILHIPFNLNFFKEYDNLKAKVCKKNIFQKVKTKKHRLLKCIETGEIGKVSYFAEKLDVFPSSFLRSINGTGKCKNFRFVFLEKTFDVEVKN